jgi:hypothetical protein
MKGPFPLNSNSIDDNILKNRCGNYVLGHADNKGTLAVMYVGRSDKNLNKRLKEHIGEKYTMFKFSYAASENIAYYEECRIYHYYKDNNYTLDNEIHPNKREDSDVTCPYCGR